MIKIGEKLPSLSLEAFQNNQINTLNLDDTKGKYLVLIFYPADFTFICPTELAEAADLYEDFQKENAELMSVSTDTAFVHKAWHDNSKTIKKI